MIATVISWLKADKLRGAGVILCAVAFILGNVAIVGSNMNNDLLANLGGIDAIVMGIVGIVCIGISVDM